MSVFEYHPDILARFPVVSGGIMVGKGLKNPSSSSALQLLFNEEQKIVLRRIGSTPLSELETLSAWRAAFRGFGVDPTGYRSAAEALLRRLTKKGDIPSINTIVDICNLVSIRYALPVAALDSRAISVPVTVRFAKGNEVFYNLGQSEGENPAEGEVIFIDETAVVLARRWCWRQSAESAAREDTSQVVITVEAQNDGGRELVKSALADLEMLLTEYTGGEFSSQILP